MKILFTSILTKKIIIIMSEQKQERHERAEAFRRQIALPGERREAIQSLIAKDSFDEADEQRIKILFSRVSLAEGCGKEYMDLIERLYKDDRLRDRAHEFYKRWQA